MLEGAAQQFQQEPWLWDERAVVVTDEHGVRPVKTVADLDSGWVVMPRVEADYVDGALEQMREPLAFTG